jgi:Flp pilus assembly protein protease CpaA
VRPAAATTITLVLVTALTACQLGFLGWWTARSRGFWEERGIRPVRSWAFTLTVALSAAAVTYPALLLVVPQRFPHSVGPWEASGAALTVFLTALAACTDMASGRVPRDVTLLTAAVAVPNMIAGMSKAGLVGVAFWVGVVGVVFAARRLLGMGDVRLLFALTFTLSWWVSVEGMLYAFLLSQGLFVIMVAVAKIFHLGSTEPLRAGGKARLHLPVAPALALGYLTAIALTTLTSHNACTSLVVVSCQRLG